MAPPTSAAASPSTGPDTCSATKPPSGKPKKVGSQRSARSLPCHGLGRGAFTDVHGVLLSIGSSEAGGARRASVMPTPRPRPGRRRRAAWPCAVVDEDHDAECDEPHAPQDVAEEVRGVDHRHVERREHTGEHEYRRRHAQHLEPAAGVATTECDDDEHGPRRGEEVPERSRRWPVPSTSLTVVNVSRASCATARLLLAASDA